jgi:predicted nucleotidyltransferase component of viral defense system
MLRLPEVRRYSTQSGLRDMMIAEKEIVLTFLLQLLSERGILDRLAFKGGTCLRKMFIGSQGRFSTDLDFTALEEHDHEDVILAMMGAFEKEFHGIRFHIPDNSYYETLDGQSWGVNPTYSHEWNGAGDSEIRLQISRRETPTLAPERRPQCEQSYFRLLPFGPAEITCLALPEILAEKIRACYQRNKARDIYDLGFYATRPLDQPLIRRLVVLKLWQAGDKFDPDRLMRKFKEGIEFDWDDLRDLVRRTEEINREKICVACAGGFGFLAELSPEERALANDYHQREQGLWDRLRTELGSS